MGSRMIRNIKRICIKKPMRRSLGVALCALVAFSLAYAPSVARALETTAKQAVLLDFETGVELYSKNADAVSYTHLTLPTKA